MWLWSFSLPILIIRACTPTGPITGNGGDGDLIAVPQFVIPQFSPPASWTFSDTGGGDAVASSDQAQTATLALAQAQSDIEGALLRAYHQYQLVSDYDQVTIGDDYLPLDCPLVFEFGTPNITQCLVERSRRGAQVTSICVADSENCDQPKPINLKMNVMVNGSSTFTREVWTNIAAAMEKYLIANNVGLEEDIKVEKIA